jgi:hypothetical protein
LLALIAAFSEVSGEAAYEVSMMHLGATGREGISTVWLLHTHTAQYCFVSTMFSHTITLYCPSLTHDAYHVYAPRSYGGPGCVEDAGDKLRAPPALWRHDTRRTSLTHCSVTWQVRQSENTCHRFHTTSPASHQITIEQPQTVIRYRAG